MALHRVAKLTVGVPNLTDTSGYYHEFGLTPVHDGRAAFSTTHGGEQLELVPAARRQLVECRIAADDPDDLGRVAASWARHDYKLERTDHTDTTCEPMSREPAVR